MTVNEMGEPTPMDQQSLAELLEAYEAAIEAISQIVGPEALIDLCRLFLLAAAGFEESNGESMPPSAQAVRVSLGRLAGLLRANKDM